MKKKLSTAAALVASAAIVLTGCSATSDAGSSDSVVFDMWAGSDDDISALKASVAIAEKQNPDLKIEMRTAPWNDFFTKLTSNMSAGKMACITGMNSGQLSSYQDGFLELTDEDLKTAGIDRSEFADGALDILSSGDTLYGIPFDLSTMLVYYNADMLEAAGAPIPAEGWTFDDFEATAKTATTGGKYGFGIGLGEFQWQALPIAKSGEQPVNDKGELDLTNPAFLDAATWYGDLVTKEKVAAPAASASDTGWGENQFSGGNAAMAVDGTWNAVGYLNNDAGFSAGLVSLPTGDNGSTSLVLGSGYGISKTCDNKEAALKVLGSLVSAEAQDGIAESGRSYPARTASQPKYFEALDADVRDSVKTAFEAAFTDVEGQRVTKDWSKVGTAIQPFLVSVYNGQDTMANVLGNVQKQFGN